MGAQTAVYGQPLHGSFLQPDEWTPLGPTLLLSPPCLWQEELEHLNQASEEINQVELQLDVSICVPSPPWAGPGPLPLVSFPLGHSGGKGHCRKLRALGPAHVLPPSPTHFSVPCQEARTTYRRILQESARKLNMQGSQLGSCIEKARPYYEARRLAKEVWPIVCYPASRELVPGSLVSVYRRHLAFLVTCPYTSLSFAPVSLFFAYPPLLYLLLPFFFCTQIRWVHWYETNCN